MRLGSVGFGIVVGALGFVSGGANAGVVSGEVTGGAAKAAGGEFVRLEVPFKASVPENTVGDDTFDTDNLYAFDESQAVFLDHDLPVDVLAKGLGRGGDAPRKLGAGITVASHYVFFDPKDGERLKGTITFDADVLAIIVTTKHLLDSDKLFEADVRYENPGLRGLEDGDVVSIVEPRTIEVDLGASTPGDYIRVLTSAPDDNRALISSR